MGISGKIVFLICSEFFRQNQNGLLGDHTDLDLYSQTAYRETQDTADAGHNKVLVELSDSSSICGGNGQMTFRVGTLIIVGEKKLEITFRVIAFTCTLKGKKMSFMVTN